MRVLQAKNGIYERNKARAMDRMAGFTPKCGTMSIACREKGIPCNCVRSGLGT